VRKFTKNNAVLQLLDILFVHFSKTSRIRIPHNHENSDYHKHIREVVQPQKVQLQKNAMNWIFVLWNSI